MGCTFAVCGTHNKYLMAQIAAAGRFPLQSTIMVIGGAGVGKTTLVHALKEADRSTRFPPKWHTRGSHGVERHDAQLITRCFTDYLWMLKLTILDTPSSRPGSIRASYDSVNTFVFVYNCDDTRNSLKNLQPYIEDLMGKGKTVPKTARAVMVGTSRHVEYTPSPKTDAMRAPVLRVILDNMGECEHVLVRRKEDLVELVRILGEKARQAKYSKPTGDAEASDVAGLLRHIDL